MCSLQRGSAPEYLKTDSLQARGFSGIWRLAGPEIRDAGARLESKQLRIIITYCRLDAGLFLVLVLSCPPTLSLETITIDHVHDAPQ